MGLVMCLFPFALGLMPFLTGYSKKVKVFFVLSLLFSVFCCTEYIEFSVKDPEIIQHFFLGLGVQVVSGLILTYRNWNRPEQNRQAAVVAKEVKSKVALPLALGIVIYPFLFGLLTLRPRYSLKSKLFSLLSAVIHLAVLVSFSHEFGPQNSSSGGLPMVAAIVGSEFILGVVFTKVRWNR